MMMFYVHFMQFNVSYMAFSIYQTLSPFLTYIIDEQNTILLFRQDSGMYQ